MSKDTITIPADLWDSSILFCGGVERLRGYAKDLSRADCGHAAARILLEHLADEIERQAPRAEGWYSVRADSDFHTRRFLYYWDGSQWLYRENGQPCRDAENFGVHGPGAVVEPVTIGGAS